MELHRSNDDQSSILPIMVLPLISAVVCFLISAVICYLSLESDYEVALTWSLTPILLLNVAATVATVALAPLMLDQTKKNTSHNLVFLALPGFTALLSQQMGLYVYLSYVQILAFSISVCCCTLVVQFESKSDHLSEEGWLEVPMEARDDTKYPDSLLANLQDRVLEVQKKWPSAQTILLAVTTIVWIHFLANSYLTPSAQHNTHGLRLEPSYTPTTAIDVVMSIYREPPSHVTDTFSLLNSLPSIGFKAPRLILYTKDPTANLTLLQQQTNATKVIRLPNVGREGHTYLHHMISSWDDLAAQTFFLQASIHNPREFTARVRDYYTAKTEL
ncbi:hypothetical protein E4T44_08766 [Aureobasidium sp. EXF-8845]|nr:hypothetical protein E4T44_08766 [Aureobasidium sp. EXF-8845]KAI4844173.1 hypothetical protein E4T45_08264 [Aureobasidium sp. EXF-8846]